MALGHTECLPHKLKWSPVNAGCGDLLVCFVLLAAVTSPQVARIRWRLQLQGTRGPCACEYCVQRPASGSLHACMTRGCALELEQEGPLPA